MPGCSITFGDPCERKAPEWHETRPEAVQADGTHRFATFCESIAKERGVRLWVESEMPHFCSIERMRNGPEWKG